MTTNPTSTPAGAQAGSERAQARRFREGVSALIECLPMHEDGTGHVADCGFDLDQMPTCGCRTLPMRFAEVLREAAERAWNEAVEAVAWASENGPDPLRYVAENNPYAAKGADRER